MKIKRCILGIPARLKSSRLPNKILADINGTPMLKRVLDRCKMVSNAYGIVVCTEDKRIFDLVQDWGGKCFLTSNNFNSGSERLSSISNKMLEICWEDQYKSWSEKRKENCIKETGIINIQGDQPFVDPEVITKLINIFINEEEPPDVITPIYKLNADNIHDPSVVKTLISNGGKAIYFSRSAIPHVRGVPFEEWFKYNDYWGHVGIYGYRAEVISNWNRMPYSYLENLEKLEQLRLIEAGYKFTTFKINGTSLSVDTKNQLEEARRIAIETD